MPYLPWPDSQFHQSDSGGHSRLPSRLDSVKDVPSQWLIAWMSFQVIDKNRGIKTDHLMARQPLVEWIHASRSSPR